MDQQSNKKTGEIAGHLDYNVKYVCVPACAHWCARARSAGWGRGAKIAGTQAQQGSTPFCSLGLCTESCLLPRPVPVCFRAAAHAPHDVWAGTSESLNHKIGGKLFAKTFGLVRWCCFAVEAAPRFPM